jgi:ATP-binding cassette subfamily B protein
MLLISLGSVLCAIATGYVAARVGASFSQRLRSLEFRKVESFGPAEMNRFSTASLITRSTNDITQIQMFVTMGLLLLVKSPIMAVWAVCKIAGKGVDWTVATAVAVAVLLVVIGVLMAMVVPKFRSMQRLTDNINLVARENLTGLRVVRAYNAEGYQETKYDKANKELSDTYLFTNRAMSVMMPLINTVMNGLMLAIYWIGAYLIERGRPQGQAHAVLEYGRLFQLLGAGHHELPADEHGLRAAAARRRVRKPYPRSARHRSVGDRWR